MELNPFIPVVSESTDNEAVGEESRYHVIVIGTQECLATPTGSLFRGKEEWEKLLCQHLQDTYHLVRTEVLAAIHISLFCLKTSIPKIKGIPHFFF
jgi:hypothetical protein